MVNNDTAASQTNNDYKKINLKRKLYLKFYILHQLLLIISLIQSHQKKKNMCCNNIKTQFSFSIYFFKTLNLIRNSFLRCQHSYFALANIWLYRYDSLFQFHLLLLGVIYCSTVNKYTVPLHTLPSNNYNEPAMPTEYNSFDCCKLHNDSK